MPKETVHRQIDISIIIPMYNAELFIENTIKSILNQKAHGLELEIIIVDDVSNDGSCDVVRKLQTEKIKLIELDVNGGSAHARNIGLRNAQGKWIQFIDSDDTICNNLYKTFNDAQQEGMNCYVFSLLIEYPGYSLMRSITTVKDKRAFGYFYAVWNLFIKRELCIEFKQVSRQNEDVCFVFDMLIEKELKIALLEDVYYILNRKNDQSKMANFKKHEYLQMYNYVNSQIHKGDKLTKMFFLESFVGIVFSKELPLSMSLPIAIKTLLKFFRYVPAVYLNGIRNCIQNTSIN